ncbi:MAG: hypothetical protein IPP38_18325 [Bacteroidetes bacterium]|nr:hypothetical protein [Bacteroidota bacterium]
MDRELKSLTDHDHNIIDMCSAVDTIIYSGYYAYPSLQVSKFDTAVFFVGKENQFHLNSYFNYTNSFIDANNNVYAWKFARHSLQYTGMRCEDFCRWIGYL